MFAVQEYQRDEYTITTDSSRFDLKVIRDFLASTPPDWAAGISRDLIKKAIDHSLCFGVFHGNDQVGLARVVTDYATYAYLTDVFILKQHRGKGLSKWLMECIMNHPELQGLRRFALMTADSHELYRRYGFTEPYSPESYMEIFKSDLYRTSGTPR